jgi:dipeptidyl aminopeptidase/acylaminoacyl peptidase
LLHGANDWRVPVDGSRKFAEAARAQGKDVTYVEFEGQGHRVKGVSRNVEAWQERLDFLSKVLAKLGEADSVAGATGVDAVPSSATQD